MLLLACIYLKRTQEGVWLPHISIQIHTTQADTSKFIYNVPTLATWQTAIHKRD